MLEFKFSNDGVQRHKCVGIKDGDWVIFKCTECDYVRKINLKTRKSTTVNNNFEILHEGSFSELEEPTVPPQFLN